MTENDILAPPGVIRAAVVTAAVYYLKTVMGRDRAENAAQVIATLVMAELEERP